MRWAVSFTVLTGKPFSPSLICRRMPRHSANDRRSLPHRLGDGEPKPCANRLLQHHCGASLQRIHQGGIHSKDEQPLINRAVDRLQDDFGLRAIDRRIAEQHERAIYDLARLPKSFNHAARVSPRQK